jgi:predicted ArsR family transcriptional regulator
VATEAGGGGEQLLFDTLASLGFQPERVPAPPGRVGYRLRNCPYRQAVHERQPLVCALHRGLTGGIVEVIDQHSRVVAFEPSDPDTGGCLIGVSGPVVAGPVTRAGAERARPPRAQASA